MHIPESFRIDDSQMLQHCIRDYGFGTLVIADKDGIEANHVPFYLDCEGGDSLGLLECHLARNNPAWKRLHVGARILAVFQGPNAYVSPSLYPSKEVTGKVVPTWNYLAVHAEGVARVVEDPLWLKRHIKQLTDHHESKLENPWSVDDAPKHFTDKLVKAIVGVEIRIEKLMGKLKASQNQPEENRLGVKAGLEASKNAMAEFIF